MDQGIRPKVDHDKCVGSRICISIAPGVFELDGDGQARIANPQGAAPAVIQAAAEACPMSAITIEHAVETKPEESGKPTSP